MQRLRQQFAKQRARIFRFASLLLVFLLSAGCELITNDECETKTYYGPPTCTTDQGCVDQYGEGWYCDKEHVIDWKCGTTWPTCAQR
ncbi:MAG: hypothetical protein JXO72_16325 [Vicinamibacteria bacterium]|nr:hypothetical protein [Vicinamibacteria bacterium]